MAGPRQWATALVQAALGIAKPLIERIISVGLIQSGVLLAAQTFMALFPLLIAVVALAPPAVAEAIQVTARQRLGLSGSTSTDLNQLVASRANLRAGITTIGVIVVLGSATSFTRALQRVYENSWQLPRLGLRGSLRGLEWLLGLIAYLSLLGLVLHVTDSHRPIIMAIRGLLAILGSVGLWWLTPYVLLCGRVRMRALLVSGVLTAVASLIAGRVSTAVMPHILARNEQQFGIIGATFAIQSWLVVLASIIVGAAILGALAAQGRGRIGRWARGTADPEGWRRVRFRRRRRAFTRPSASPASAGPESPG